MSVITSTIAIVLPDTSALDDITTEDDALTNAWSSAVAKALGKADREDRRAKRTAVTVDAKRNDRWSGDDAEIHAYLAANPAF